MDFQMNEETSLLRTTAEKFLRDKCPLSVAKEIMKNNRGFSESLWKKMAELGWLGFVYDEKYGGMGGSFFDLFVLFCEIGKALLPSPIFCSSVMSGFLIDEGGSNEQKTNFLPSITSGKRIFTVGYLDQKGKCDINSPGVRATRGKSGDYVIDGTAILVPYAHLADTVLVYASFFPAQGKSEPTIFAIDCQTEGIRRASQCTLSGESASALIFQHVTAPPDVTIGLSGSGTDTFQRVLPKATVLKCGEMLGGLERVLHMTVGYVKERYQFGRPLGSLQVVQHYCADMATYLETSRLISQQAAFLMNEGLSCRKEISMAKAWCNEAYRKTTWIAHQLHGGIGFTEEHDLHLYYKHAKECELEFDNSWYHRAIVAEEMGI
jgi:alkylation response protein AidB-like acyl-CoA dehydrogenase